MDGIVFIPMVIRTREWPECRENPIAGRHETNKRTAANMKKIGSRTSELSTIRHVMTATVGKHLALRDANRKLIRPNCPDTGSTGHNAVKTNPKRTK